MKRKKNTWFPLLRGLLLPVIAAAALLCFATALESLDSGRAEEDKQHLEETLRRGCVACYATEGVYPPDVEYLEEHYGVLIDRNQYTVSYIAIAENLMPDITVLENKP